jgi:hypothetical protein
MQITEMRTSSGTAWQPETAPMYAMHGEAGGWDLMFHGNVFGAASVQASERGDAGLTSMNSFMGMASRDVGRGQLGARAMMSLEPLTIGPQGYPLLLQTGETYDGEPLVDRQHPHDLFMELAGTWRHEVTKDVGVELYVAPVGEPALGPVAFPHRASAISDPVAPLAHHWQDATHITFGVVTAGVYNRSLKLEGSVFNGREPDENRYDFDFRPLDSYSTRLSWAPSREIVVAGSYGYLDSPEALEPDHRVHRVVGAATWSRPIGEDRTIDTTAAWGHNFEGSPGGDWTGTDGALLETNVDLGRHWIVFGRLGHDVKAAHDLALEQFPEDRTFQLHSANLGGMYTFEAFEGWESGLAVRANGTIVPEALESAYGSRFPVGMFAYVQLRPAPAHAD